MNGLVPSEHPCREHPDTLLLWSEATGYVCPKGCGWQQAGRRWSHKKGRVW